MQPFCKRLAEVLDLGCGTGLELEYYFARNPGARVQKSAILARAYDIISGLICWQEF